MVSFKIMPVEDTFPYTARFDPVGLDCSHCRHQQIGSGFPNHKRDYCCGLHDMSLTIELQENGFKLWEWFFRDFESDGRGITPEQVQSLIAKDAEWRTRQERALVSCVGEPLKRNVRPQNSTR
jgi:hypothetical protein